MASLRNSVRAPTLFKAKIKNPATNEQASGKIYNVISNTRTLSEQKIITYDSESSDAVDDSIAVLSAFGVTVVEHTENTETTLLTGNFLDNKKLEKFEKTQDINPNRLQVKKFKSLTSNKIAASEIFNQMVNNPINDLDTCQPSEMKTETVPPINVIEIVDSFINFSTIPLATRLVNK